MNLDEAMSAAAEKLSGDATEAPAEPVSETAPVTEAPSAEATETAAAAQRARDEAGKFTKAPKAKPAPKSTEKPAGTAPTGGVHGAASAAPPAAQGPAAGAAPSTAPAAEPVSPALKAPSSWSPQEREAFAKGDAEGMRKAAVRIDREVRQVMQESAEAKRTAESVQRTLAPFEGIARASGMDVMAYAGSVMQTAAQLFQGPPGNRAALIAHLIKQAGVNPEDVNPYLAGEVPPAQRQPAYDPRAEVQKVLAEERQRQEAEQGQAVVQEFLATEPEFIGDVWPVMVGLINADRAAGRKPDMQSTYDRACWANPDVRAQLQKRSAAEAARTATAATQAAKTAAVSIKSSSPAPQVGTKTKGIDAAMDKARAKLGM